MTFPFSEKEINRFFQLVYEHFISFTVVFSILLYILWNLTRYIFSLVLNEGQQSIANRIQEFFNSVLITLLILFFIISIQRREFYFFEHLSLINNGIIKTTKKPYKIQYANNRVLDLLGYNEEQVVNQNLDFLFCKEERAKLNTFLNDSTIPTIKNIEMYLTTKSGVKTPVLFSISRVYNAFSKKEKGLFIVINDIKSLKESQNQLRHLMQIEKDSMINSFVQKVGHEINNPLTFMLYDSERLIEYVSEMIGMLKIYDEVDKKLQLESDEPELVANMKKIEQIKKEMKYESAITDLEEILTATKDGINRIAKVVKEVRTYPFQETEIHRQSINNIIKLTIDVIKNNYLKQNDNITITTNLDLNIPLILIKSGEIAQCLLNIILNSIQAIEAKGPEGTITIQTKILPSLSDDVDQNQLIELSIEDNGIGIKRTHLPRIFDPYFTTKPEGTGLGLSNVKKVLEDHNGEIKIESEYNKGTKLIIILPAY